MAIERLTRRHVVTRGTCIFINVKTARSRFHSHGEARFSSLHRDAWSVRFPSDDGEDSWKKSTIVARSNRDRGVIEPRSWLLQRGIEKTILSTDSDGNHLSTNITIDAQSWLRLKRNQGQFTANSRATTSSIETALMTPAIHSHNRINRPRSLG